MKNPIRIAIIPKMDFTKYWDVNIIVKAMNENRETRMYEAEEEYAV